MIHIFLVILKIIGILLAVFLILAVLLSLLLLFWPVKYRIYGKLQKKFVFHMNFSFMKPVLMVCFDYEKEMNFYIKVMGINVLKREQNESNRNSDDDFTKQEPKSETDKESESKDERKDEIKDKIDVKEKDTAGDIKQIKQEKQSTESGKIKAKNKFFKGAGEKVIRKIKAIKAFIKRLYRSLKALSEYPLKIKEFLKDKRIYSGYQALKDEVLYLLKKSKPQKYRWYIHYGTGDPCITGQILGLLGILYAAWGKGLVVEPDFEQKVFQSEFDCKGKMRGIYALRFILKLYKNKDINYLKEQILKIRRN